MSRQSAVRKPEQKLYSQRILVMIDRDMTEKTSKVIWSHEKPLLELLHGEGKVIEVDPNTLNEGYSAKLTPQMIIHKPPNGATLDKITPPSQNHGLGFLFVGDAGSEYQRLAEAYGMLPEEKILVVEKAYGRFQTGVFGELLGTPSLEELPEAQLRSVLTEYNIEIPADANLVKLAEDAGIQF